MNSAKKDANQYNFKIINEFKNRLNAKDINIHIYTLPVNDIDNTHSEHNSIMWKLRKLNKENNNIIFFKNYIASFDSIDIWEDPYVKYECKSINTSILSEKTLLERLILSDIKVASVKSGYKCNKEGIFSKEPIYRNNGVIAYRMFKFDVNVEDNGNIIVGCNSNVSYEYINTVDIDIKKSTLKPGDIVRDYYKGGTYSFIGLADFTIGDKNDYLEKSIIDYYKDRNEAYIVEKLNPKMQAVLVSSNKDKKQKIFPYIPSRLKKQLSFDKLPADASKVSKLPPTNRMNILIQTMRNIAVNCRYFEYKSENRLTCNLGYKDIYFKKPILEFNNCKTSHNIATSLFTYGCYNSKPIEVSYFIDPYILRDKETFNDVISFTNELEKFSSKAKVQLKRTMSGVNFKEIRMENKDIFEMDLRNIASNYKGASIFIMTDDNGEKYYNSVKKVFGNKNGIPTQFIYTSTIKNATNEKKYKDKKKYESARSMIYANILLGIYGKSGIQPFVLSERLSADCFIGLDVSREDGVNTAGVVQVIGNDGRLMNCKIVNAPQKGEKIKIETIKEILLDAISLYKKEYGKDLKHIVFHRDGLNLEDINTLQETANNLGIKFDYVEITKNVARRIAQTDMDNLKYGPDGNLNVKELKLKTVLGSCSIKGDSAYLTTTSPKEYMGMAQPIRITKVSGESSIEDIAKDAYNLSYMHVGSVNKVRLPVTTYYADLSSTYGNRGLLPPDMDGEELHFI